MGTASQYKEWRSGAIRELLATARDHTAERLCQIIVNATGKNDSFYVTDAELAKALHEYREKHSGKAAV